MTDGLRHLDPVLRRAWHPLCRSSEATNRPAAFRLLDTPYVVFRDGAGDVKVFEDRCPHRRAPLSLGTCEGATLRCLYHGWAFDHEGRCVEIPSQGNSPISSRAVLSAPFGVAERHGIVFVAPESPVSPLPTLAVDADPTFQRGDLDPITTRGNAGLLADNFLDMAHFAFVHTGTFGAGEATAVGPYEVVRDGFGFEAIYEHDFANREDPAVATGERPLVQRRRLTYRYSAPFHLELALDFLDAGGTNVIGFFLAPRDAEHVTIYSSLWRNDLEGSEERMAEAVAYEVAVVEEDLALQSRYHDLVLPLDLTDEVHVKADKTTIELRRILADLVRAAAEQPVNF
jgi:vanillate O-demethylase monooxygenase subunit